MRSNISDMLVSRMAYFSFDVWSHGEFTFAPRCGQIVRRLIRLHSAGHFATSRLGPRSARALFNRASVSRLPCMLLGVQPAIRLLQGVVENSAVQPGRIATNYRWRQ